MQIEHNLIEVSKTSNQCTPVSLGPQKISDSSTQFSMKSHRTKLGSEDSILPILKNCASDLSHMSQDLTSNPPSKMTSFDESSLFQVKRKIIKKKSTKKPQKVTFLKSTVNTKGFPIIRKGRRNKKVKGIINMSEEDHKKLMQEQEMKRIKRKYARQTKRYKEQIFRHNMEKAFDRNYTHFQRPNELSRKIDEQTFSKAGKLSNFPLDFSGWVQKGEAFFSIGKNPEYLKDKPGQLRYIEDNFSLNKEARAAKNFSSHHYHDCSESHGAASNFKTKQLDKISLSSEFAGILGQDKVSSSPQSLLFTDAFNSLRRSKRVNKLGGGIMSDFIRNLYEMRSLDDQNEFDRLEASI